MEVSCNLQHLENLKVDFLLITTQQEPQSLIHLPEKQNIHLQFMLLLLLWLM